MKKRNSAESLKSSLENLNLNPCSNNESKQKVPVSASVSSSRTGVRVFKSRPPCLVSLCLGVVGRHLEDIIPYLAEISVNFPAGVKMTIVSIARRRKLLDDDVIVSLADSSWKILDISGSDISDAGLAKVAEMCRSLRAVDISRCSKITFMGVSELVQHCRSLETLRCGGCLASESTARRCLGLFKPNLNDVGGETWEELYNTEIGHGGQSLRWLVWPTIDKDSFEMLNIECPRIVINPKPSLLGYRGQQVPREALLDVSLDEPFVKDIDPKTWVGGIGRKPTSQTPSGSNEMPIAERFRLAFAERDARLAPKRAKNVRQHQRRAEREWMMSSSEAKAMALASKATRSLRRN
ncbi:PREDICTED: uncharacterized protein LOC104809268 [Tarenaya hassleriana]|uniref:uncharacterized protein LOC104809268 n=1 Tax=Tarenaya hassleriana TaxID=28532 RepID=UPI00053C2DC1|nr:PREDICTED: uncharacterized protein LOC104809268 [Tarenaya hassleriana]